MDNKVNVEDKAERVLSMYSRLKQGRIINKSEESVRYNVAPRTIQRDIADIQCFLKNQNNEAGEVQEVVYDRVSGGYRLETKIHSQLKPKEVLAISKILLESRAMVKEELFPIINKMLYLCSGEEERKLVKEYIRNEMHHYIELQHHQKLLDRIWSLEDAIRKQQYVEIQYEKLKNKEIVIRKVKPVGVMFNDFYFYVTAFIDGIDKEEHFQNPEDIFPTIYRVDRIKDIKALEEHFAVPYSERFEEGEFRKRIQFMYGGKLRKIKLKCKKEALESVLDRFPTAQILKEEAGGYVIRAEVFGDGVDIWLRGQADIKKVE